MTILKRCSKCKTHKSILEFHPNGKNANGTPRLRGACKACEAIRSQGKPKTLASKITAEEARLKRQRAAHEKAVGPQMVKPLCDFVITDDMTGCHLSTQGTQNDYPVLAKKDSLDRFHHRHVMAVIHGQEALSGKEVHHTCYNPQCVNPAHLEVLSIDEHAAVHYLDCIKAELDDLDTIELALRIHPEANRERLAWECNIEYSRLCKLVRENKLKISRKWER